jgi:hypothetical protein
LEWSFLDTFWVRFSNGKRQPSCFYHSKTGQKSYKTGQKVRFSNGPAIECPGLA